MRGSFREDGAVAPGPSAGEADGTPSLSSGDPFPPGQEEPVPRDPTPGTAPVRSRGAPTPLDSSGSFGPVAPSDPRLLRASSSLPRPYTVVNMAMSADGKISSVRRRQVRISGQADRERVDRLKAESDAVMVGIGTVLADNPSLTVKSADLKKERLLAGRPENPVRVVVDGRGRTPPGADILHKGPGERIIAVSGSAGAEAAARYRGLATVIAAGDREVDLPFLMARLHERGIRRLMVEGGGSLVASLLAAGLVDEFYTFVGNLVIGGREAPTPVDGPGFPDENAFLHLSLLDVAELDEGVLLRWQVRVRP